MVAARQYTRPGMTGILIIFVLFVLFLLPFDRRIIERYIMRIGAEPAAPASLKPGTRSGKMGDGFSETPLPAGPYTRQLCNILDLEVVSHARRKYFIGARQAKIAIGRWNKETREFEIVTEWCATWEELEEEARQAVKSFRELANPKYRGA